MACPFAGQPPAGSKTLLSRLIRRRALSRLDANAPLRRLPSPACPSLMWKASMAAAAARALAVLCRGTCCMHMGLMSQPCQVKLAPNSA